MHFVNVLQLQRDAWTPAPCIARVGRMKADMTVAPAYSTRCTVLAVLVGAVHDRDPSRHGTCFARPQHVGQVAAAWSDAQPKWIVPGAGEQAAPARPWRRNQHGRRKQHLPARLFVRALHALAKAHVHVRVQAALLVLLSS